MIKNIFKKVIPIHIMNFIKRYLIYFPFEKASIYSGKVLQEYSFKNSLKDNICIFSHYDKDDIIDEYVVNYIKNISEKNFDIVFVSTAENLHINETEKIKDYCMSIIVKENIGYDFGAWSTGMIYVDNELNSYDSLLLCNDSVYAPLFPLADMFNNMKGNYDFWGITDSLEVFPHIQSYFMMFDSSVISSEVFIDFWKDYKVFKIKRNIILNYEIGLSQKLKKSGFSLGSYCPFDKLNTSKVRNSSHYHWQELIVDFKCPIIKVELLRDNPQNIDISKWEDVINQKTQCNINLIKEHLKRVKK